LALLLAGLAMPSGLPPKRWAFTPPFHPYSGFAEGEPTTNPSGLFSVALSLGLPQPAINRRHAFLESGLSSHSRSHPAIRTCGVSDWGIAARGYLGSEQIESKENQ